MFNIYDNNMTSKYYIMHGKSMFTDSNLKKETLLQEEIDKLPPLLPAHVLLHLPTQHHINTGIILFSVDQAVEQSLLQHFSNNV